MKKVIISIFESGELSIDGEADENGDGFFPGEVALILEEATAKMKRIDHINLIVAQYKHALAQEEARKDPAKRLLVPN